MDPETAPETAPAGVSEPEDASEHADPQVKKLREEAKRYRTSLRETEGHLTVAQSRVDRYQQHEAADTIGRHLHQDAVEDFWLTHEISEFRSEDGELDLKKLGSAASGVAKTRPHWAVPKGPSDGGAGVRRPVKQPESFGQILKDVAHGR